MLTELKRCNSIGNIDGVLFLISILSGKQQINKKEVINRAALENDITLNAAGAIAFFEYLGYVCLDCDNIIPTEEFNILINEKTNTINTIVKKCIDKLTDDGLFDMDETMFDVEKGHLCIKRNAFPLSYAAIRNFLTMVGVLDKEVNGEIGITESFEFDFSENLRARRKKFTLAQLIEKQEEQNKRGLAAEEFVLQLEKNRMPQKCKQIKRISDFDVSAGYDIVSFQNSESENYDLFIEVKCYIGEPHFYWSENEVDVAKIKGEKYCLCLVDFDKIKDVGYTPLYITNPVSEIFRDETWLVNTASYKIKKYRA